MYNKDSIYDEGFRESIESKLEHIPLYDNGNYYVHYKEDVPVLLREIDRLKELVK